MKKCALLLICISFLLPAKSFSNYLGDSIRGGEAKHELSISYDLPATNSISMNYARRISEKNWLKFGLNLGGYYESNQPQTQMYYPNTELNFETTFLLGLENHKTIKSNFEFISGFNVRLATGFNYNKVENPSLPISMRNTSTFYFNGLGVGATFGLFYKVSDNFSVGSSLNPLIMYTTSQSPSYETKLLSMYLSNVSVVCLRYKL